MVQWLCLLPILEKDQVIFHPSLEKFIVIPKKIILQSVKGYNGEGIYVYLLIHFPELFVEVSMRLDIFAIFCKGKKNKFIMPKI